MLGLVSNSWSIELGWSINSTDDLEIQSENRWRNQEPFVMRNIQPSQRLNTTIVIDRFIIVRVTSSNRFYV